MTVSDIEILAYYDGITMFSAKSSNNHGTYFFILLNDNQDYIGIYLSNADFQKCRKHQTDVTPMFENTATRKFIGRLSHIGVSIQPITTHITDDMMPAKGLTIPLDETSPDKHKTPVIRKQ